MRVARLVAAFVLVGALGATTAGCTPIHCWGARSGGLNSSDLAPQVLWNTTAWFTSHPSSRLQVCVDKTCRTVTSANADSLQLLGLVPLDFKTDASDQVYKLTAAATQGGATLARTSRKSKMHPWVADAGTCFAQTGYKLNASVSNNGSIGLK